MKLLFFTIALFLTTSVLTNAQTVSTFIGGTPDDGIALDSNGNIYCSNYVGDTVFKFTPTGDVSSFITGLVSPNGLAFNSNDELYVCDGQANTVNKYDSNGNLMATYATSGHPSGIVKSHESDTMIFTQFVGNTINSLAPDGTITPLSTDAALNGPVGIATDANGSIYIGNYIDRKMYSMDASGTLTYIAQLPTDGGASPNLGFISYGGGFLWGTTMGSDKVYRINPAEVDDIALYAGNVQGSDDGPLQDATFNTPNGILFDETSNTIYITDFGTKNLRIISDVSLAVEDFSTYFDLAVYPNPVKDSLEVTFSLPKTSGYQLEIYTVLGEQIYQAVIKTTSNKVVHKIDMSNWSRGAYFLKVKSGNFIAAKKIVK